MTTQAARPDTLLVRPARVEESAALAALYRTNREYLEPFEPARDEDFFTTAGQATWLAALPGVAAARTDGTDRCHGGDGRNSR